MVDVRPEASRAPETSPIDWAEVLEWEQAAILGGIPSGHSGRLELVDSFRKVKDSVWGSYENPAGETKDSNTLEQWHLDLSAKDKKYWDSVGFWEGGKSVEFKAKKKEDARARKSLEKQHYAASQIDNDFAHEKTASGPPARVEEKDRPTIPKPHPDAKYMKVGGAYAWFVPDTGGNLNKVEGLTTVVEEPAVEQRGGTPARPDSGQLGSEDRPVGLTIKQSWDMARVLDWVMDNLPKALSRPA